MKTSFLIAFVLVASFTCFAQKREENRAFWFDQGQAALKRAIKVRPIVGVAKNVIMFIGDGMGVPTITAARILKGQLEGGYGEEYRLQIEKLPFTGLAKTYNTNKQTPDSAGTGTAYWSGVKTQFGVLGVDQTIVKGNCSNLESAKMDTILDWTLREGKSVGIVSTARITHASPGAGYAKIPDREWENDAKMAGVPGCEHVQDIARQLVENHDGIQVLLGGGRANFLNQTNGGNRLDGRNLIEAWKDNKNAKGVKHKYVETGAELKNISSDTEFLLGLFNDEHMRYDSEREAHSEPSLAEMVEKAHQILSKNEKGYFLFVEGAKIDIAHHHNLAHQSLLDMIAFDKAIEKAVNLTDEKDTLIMATADHSHVFVMAGYPPRGFSIVDKMMYDVEEYKIKKPTDGKPMTVLMYANGPGPQRNDLTKVDTTDLNFQYPNAVPTESETHGGEDVAVFARGPMAHLVQGVHEQNVLPHIMAYASCVGVDKSLCEDDSDAQFCEKTGKAGGSAKGGKGGNKKKDEGKGKPGGASTFHASSKWVNALSGIALIVVCRLF